MIRDAVTIVNLGATRDGHRGSYIDTLCALFACDVRGFGLRGMLARPPVLVPMVEESFARYVALCLIRAVLGRRTVGLLFRPRPAVDGMTVRLRAKRLALRLLRRLAGVRTLTILPFAVEPRFAQIANGWIHDLQLWDLCLPGTAASLPAPGALAAAIRAVAAGRGVCCAIGRQDRAKGFDTFARAWLESPALRQSVLFAYGGKVAADCAAEAERFAAAQGFSANRLVSDQELLDLYACADIVWGVYDPAYDQASGIVGRAMQLGIPVAVRAGSLVERLCLTEDHPCLSLEDPVGLDLSALPTRLNPAVARQRAERHARESIATLREALGLTGAV